MENELIYHIKRLKYAAFVISDKIAFNKSFKKLFKDEKIKKIYVNDPIEAISVCLGFHLGGERCLLILSKASILNSITNLNDMKIKEIPIPILIGEKFNLFAEPITILKIRRVLRGINVPFFVIKRDIKNLKKLEDFLSFSEVMKCPVVCCIDNELWSE
ncbi:MAG: hypothetical protein ACTSVY_11075 [Candidatus Helarchaeota archaeon]